MDFSDIEKDIEQHWRRLVDGYQPVDTGEPLPANYMALPAAEKRALLQDRLGVPYDHLPTRAEGNALRLVDKDYLQPLFTHAADEQPPAHADDPQNLRDKLVHCFGAAGSMTFTPRPDSPYTGVLAEPADVIVRLADAANPSDPHMPYNQSVAVKFLVDGRPSVNLLTLADPEGQGADTNFFARDLATYSGCPSSFALKVCYVAFQRAIADPAISHGCPQSARQLPLHALAAISGHGASVHLDRVRAPVGIRLQPAEGLRGWWAETVQEHPGEDWRLTLGRIPEKSHLYDVVAATPATGLAPGQRPDPERPRVIGRLDTLTRLLPSAFADRRLMFQHPLRTEDEGAFPPC